MLSEVRERRLKRRLKVYKAEKITILGTGNVSLIVDDYLGEENTVHKGWMSGGQPESFVHFNIADVQNFDVVRSNIVVITFEKETWVVELEKKELY